MVARRFSGFSDGLASDFLNFNHSTIWNSAWLKFKATISNELQLSIDHSLQSQWELLYQICSHLHKSLPTVAVTHLAGNRHLSLKMNDFRPRCHCKSLSAECPWRDRFYHSYHLASGVSLAWNDSAWIVCSFCWICMVACAGLWCPCGSVCG